MIINNVNNEEIVQKMASDFVKRGVIDNFYLASNYSDRVLKEYDITKESFGANGYNYSIAELVGIYKCKTKYLLHFSSDSYIPFEFCSSKWIDNAIELMESNLDIIVANPTWNYKWDEACNDKIESINDCFWLSQGFSDQCYLINTEVFKNKIYNYVHKESERYPAYGGNLFEKRVDAFMRTTGKYRLVAKKVSYISKNITNFQIFMEKFGLKKI